MNPIRVPLFVTLVYLIFLAGCGAPGGDPGATSTPDPSPTEGCGECKTELDGIQTKVEALPQVTQFFKIGYGQSDNDLRPSTVSIQVGVQKGSTQEVEEAITKIVWSSRLTPVESIALDMAPPEPARIVAGGAQFVPDTIPGYEEKWGPRPVK